MKDFLSASSPVSLMRLVVVTMVWTACLYILVLLVFNLYQVKLGNCEDVIPIDWIGVTTFATAALLGKVGQHFSENKNKKEETPITPIESR